MSKNDQIRCLCEVSTTFIHKPASYFVNNMRFWIEKETWSPNHGSFSVKRHKFQPGVFHPGLPCERLGHDLVGKVEHLRTIFYKLSTDL